VRLLFKHVICLYIVLE